MKYQFIDEQQFFEHPKATSRTCVDCVALVCCSCFFFLSILFPGVIMPTVHNSSVVHLKIFSVILTPFKVDNRMCSIKSNSF